MGDAAARGAALTRANATAATAVIVAAGRDWSASRCRAEARTLRIGCHFREYILFLFVVMILNAGFCYLTARR